MTSFGALLFGTEPELPREIHQVFDDLELSKVS